MVWVLIGSDWFIGDPYNGLLSSLYIWEVLSTANKQCVGSLRILLRVFQKKTFPDKKKVDQVAHWMWISIPFPYKNYRGSSLTSGLLQTSKKTPTESQVGENYFSSFCLITESIYHPMFSKLVGTFAWQWLNSKSNRLGLLRNLWQFSGVPLPQNWSHKHHQTSTVYEAVGFRSGSTLRDCFPQEKRQDIVKTGKQPFITKLCKWFVTVRRNTTPTFLL